MVTLWRRGGVKIVEARKERRQNESRLDRLLAGMFYKLFAYTTSLDLEGASDFKLLDRSVVDAWKELPERRVFFRGMAQWVGFPRAEILFTPPDRPAGGSKWSCTKKLTLVLAP